MKRDVVECNALEPIVDTVTAVVIRLEFKVDVDNGAGERHALIAPVDGTCIGGVEDVQVGQVNRGCCNKIVCVEENVVVSTRSIS